MSKHSNGVKKSKVSKDEVKASSGSIMSFFGRPSKDSNPVSAFSSSNNVEENQQKSISIEKDKDPSSEPISKKRRIIDDVADHDESEKDLDDKMPLEEQDTSEDSMEEMHPQVEGSSEDIFYSESEELPVISKSKTKSSKLKVSNSKKCPSKFLDYDLSLQKWKKGER